MHTHSHVYLAQDKNFLDLYWPNQPMADNPSPSSSPTLMPSRSPSDTGSVDSVSGSRKSSDNVSLAMSIDSGLSYMDEMDFESGFVRLPVDWLVDW